jgi:hypothetical protein
MREDQVVVIGRAQKVAKVMLVHPSSSLNPNTSDFISINS